MTDLEVRLDFCGARMRVIADDDGTNLDGRSGAGVFGQAGGDVAEADLDGRGIGIDIGGRRVDPELRMLAVATALFANDVQQTIVVHSHAFKALGGDGEGIAWVGGDGQGVGNRAGATNVDYLSIFLTQHQQVAIGHRQVG